MALDAQPAAVSQPAPLFSLPSVQGATVDLVAYRGRQNVIVWFSRGFTCPFCRGYMQGIIEGYRGLLAADAEDIQVTPSQPAGSSVCRDSASRAMPAQA